MDIEGKVALVTGAATGIGFVYVKELLRNGAKHVSILDLETSNGEESARKLNEEFGTGRVIFIICDVTKSAEFEDAFKKTVTEFGRLDIVVNNAGIMRDSVWELMIAINFNAVVTGTLLGLQYMGKDRGGNGGIIVNVSSIVGIRPWNLIPIYTGTKHAVVGLSRSFGEPANYEKTGVRVVTICPSSTNTDLVTGAHHRQLEMMSSNAVKDCLTTMYCQSPETVAVGLIHIIRTATSGSVWVSMDDQPIWEVKFPSHLGPIETHTN